MANSADVAAKALEGARRHFSPELWNRIEEKLVFEPLSQDDVERVARLLLRDSADRLKAEANVSYTVHDAVIPLLIEQGGYDPRLGARPMRRVVQDLVEGAVAAFLLSDAPPPGAVLHVGVFDGEIVVERTP
jgi:ATP-dependent Clp protease ATP-binding subunit ClpC